jgi:phosphatidyl-myo-inositol alpha-mannosyltransferase
MKIGLVCPYNVNRGGGVQEIIRDMYAGLKERGHEVRILTPRPRDISNVDTTDTIFLGSGADVRSPGMKTLPTFSASVDTDTIDQVLEQEQFDILHFHEPWVPVLSRQILVRSKAVNIATFHAAIPETMVSRTITSVVTPYALSVLKYLHKYTAVSDAAAVYISSLTNEPIQIIPNAIDLTRYTWKSHPLPAEGPRTILYVGRLEARKGLKYLLRAFQVVEAQDENVRLLLAGSGPDREKLELLVEDLHLKNVTFLGHVSDAEKMRLLADADLFCSPALYGESFGIVLLEAMARGVVTVAGNNAGYEGVMRETGRLSIVNPRDSAEFARRLQLLLNDEALRATWQKWAKTYVQQFDYPHVIDLYEQCYKDALKKHAAAVAR